MAIALVLLVFASVATAGTAQAQYTPGQTEFILDPSTVGPGDTVFAIGTGCPPGGLVEIFIDGVLVATGTASGAGGAFEISFIAPPVAGDYVVNVQCGGVSVNQILTVGVSSCGFIVQGVPGSQVTVNAPGFKVGTGYNLRWMPGDTALGSGVIDNDPQTFNFQIPLSATAGDYELLIDGVGRNDAPRNIECQVTVLASAAPVTPAITTTTATATLPVTGSEAMQIVKAALGLLAVGGLMLIVARRGRSAARA